MTFIFNSPVRGSSNRRRDNTSLGRPKNNTQLTNEKPSDISDESTDDDVQIISTVSSNTRGISSGVQRGSKAVSYVYDSDTDEQLETERQHDQHQLEIASTKIRSMQPIENKPEIKGKGKRKKWNGKGKENKILGNNDTDQGVKRKRTSLQQKTMDDYEHVKTEQQTGLRKSGRVKKQRHGYSDHFAAGPSTSLVDFSQSGDDYDDNDNIDRNSITNGRHHGKCYIVDEHVQVDSETDDESTTVVLPTPQDNNKRSLFTRRQHKPMLKSFDDDSDDEQGHNNNTQMIRHKQDLAPAKKCTVVKGKEKKTRRRIKVFDSDSD